MVCEKYALEMQGREDRAGFYEFDNEPCGFLQESPVYVSKFQFSRSGRLRTVICDEIL